jgi:hypothetical protein
MRVKEANLNSIILVREDANGAGDSEVEAFRAFARARPQGLTLLIDTYDTEQAAHRVVAHSPPPSAIWDPYRRGPPR